MDGEIQKAEQVAKILEQIGERAISDKGIAQICNNAYCSSCIFSDDGKCLLNTALTLMEAE